MDLRWFVGTFLAAMSLSTAASTQTEVTKGTAKALPEWYQREVTAALLDPTPGVAAEVLQLPRAEDAIAAIRTGDPDQRKVAVDALLKLAAKSQHLPPAIRSSRAGDGLAGQRRSAEGRGRGAAQARLKPRRNLPEVRRSRSGDAPPGRCPTTESGSRGAAEAHRGLRLGGRGIRRRRAGEDPSRGCQSARCRDQRTCREGPEKFLLCWFGIDRQRVSCVTQKRDRSAQDHDRFDNKAGSETYPGRPTRLCLLDAGDDSTL